MAEPTSRIRSALFTPGTEASRLRKAVTLGSDVCIFDLEDSVPAGREADARRTVREALDELHGRGRIWLRVHSASSPQMVEDLGSIPLANADAVMLPKVRSPDDVINCRAVILAAGGPSDLPIVAMIETAMGVLNAGAIAQAPEVVCLAFGRFDLSADLGVDPDGGSPALTTARAAVVLASTAAGLLPALDSPWLKIRDLDGLRAAAQRSRADGFGGMQVIHPSHLDALNAVFSPTAEERAWARAILASAGRAESDGRGAYTHEGQMVDEAIVKRARAILRDAPS